MYFNFKNKVRVLMFEHPIDKDMLCLFSYKENGDPLVHGSTSVDPTELVERLRRIEAYDPLEINIELENIT